MKRYNSVAMIAFTVHHDEEDGGDVKLNEVRAALMRRIADLDENNEWDQAVSFEDTVENQEGNPYVMFSALELATTGTGFWSNTKGWTDLSSATRFSESERRVIGHLMPSRIDARWVDINNAPGGRG